MPYIIYLSTPIKKIKAFIFFTLKKGTFFIKYDMMNTLYCIMSEEVKEKGITNEKEVGL